MPAPRLPNGSFTAGNGRFGSPDGDTIMLDFLFLMLGAGTLALLGTYAFALNRL